MVVDSALLEALRTLEERVAAATARLREGDPDPDNAFRGLYITDEQIDRMLREDGPDRLDEASLNEAEHGVLGQLARSFGLTPMDVQLLLVAVAPDLDQRFERFYGYLHDDVTRRRASPGLALELLGISPFDADARSRFSVDAPLVSMGLVILEDRDRPFLTRSLRVPDRVAHHLLGGTTIDPDLSIAITDIDRRADGIERDLATLLQSDGPALVYLRQRTDAGAAGIAAAAIEHSGQEPLVLDLRRVEGSLHLEFAELAVREARLSKRGLVVGPVDELNDAVIRHFAEQEVAVLFHGSNVWDADRTTAPVLTIEVDAPDRLEQQELWARELGGAGSMLDEVVGSFRLGPTQVRRAVAAGHAYACASGLELDFTSLAAGARSQNTAGLERLARRVEPDASWTDIVLPGETRDQLEHVVARVAHRSEVLDKWGFRRGGGRGEGITALFAGDSGTGKTLAAEVIAEALGLDMYVIDLSTVVDKYIGETEKNLERIFTEAEGVNGILFFDEADALFGKRSEVSDARDRYANVEVAYLLQRMEQFDGLAVLASNLRGNLDDAFARRLSIVVDFPDPDADQRRQLWDVLLGDAPLDADVDIDFLAHRFELTGGNIRNVAVTAAYLAASVGDAIDMAALIRGVQVEYRKLGRLTVESEFGPYHQLLSRGPSGTDELLIAT